MRLISKLAVLSAFLSGAQGVAFADTIYSNYTGSSIQLVGPAPVFGNAGFFGNAGALAYGFRSTGNYSVTEVDVAAGASNAPVLSIWTNVNGTLGTELGSWSVTTTHPLGQTFFPAAVAISNIALMTNQDYFVQLYDVNQFGAWVNNNTGVTGPEVHAGIATNDVEGAFRVLGVAVLPPPKPVPEPSTRAMLILGLLGIGAAARLGRKKESA